MSEPLTVATVEIVRELTDDGDNVYVRAVDGNDEDLPLVEALGLLRFAGAHRDLEHLQGEHE